MKRIILIIIAVGLLAAGGIWLDAQSRPIVDTAQPASGGAAAGPIHAPGIVEGADRQRELRLQVAGRIEKIYVREGEFVDAGQTLVKLDDTTQRHQVALLRAELAHAHAKLERLRNGAHEQERQEARAIYDAKVQELANAEREWGRAQRLMESKAIGEQELQRFETNYRTLNADVRAAKSRLELLTAPAREDEVAAAIANVDGAKAKLLLAETELARTELTAPCAGQILELNREPGELIELADHEPVVVLADTRRLRVRAYVEEFDAPHVQPGMTARITADGLPGQVFAGEVVQVLPRMSFKQVWTDRPDERFDIKTREVVIEVEDLISSARSPEVTRSQVHGGGLVYGLMVEVEILAADNLERARSSARAVNR